MGWGIRGASTSKLGGFAIPDDFAGEILADDHADGNATVSEGEIAVATGLHLNPAAVEIKTGGHRIRQALKGAAAYLGPRHQFTATRTRLELRPRFLRQERQWHDDYAR